MQQKILRLTLILALLLVPLWILLPQRSRGETGGYNPQSRLGNMAADRLERRVTANFPFSTALRQLGLDLRILGGQKEYSGVYLGGERLMKKLDDPASAFYNTNLAAVVEFADYGRELGVPVYLALIPSAGGVMTQELPRYASAVDQSRIIEDTYSALIGKVSTVNAYGALTGHREGYIYLRTEDNLTAYGGYLVYTEMAARLLGTETAGLAEFHITYEMEDYYGDLYQMAPYRDIAPDLLSAYRYSANPREYLVTHTMTGGERKVYHTLYPTGAVQLGSPMNLYLGGQSAVVDIRTSAPNSRRLLVFGDKSVLTWLPLLAGHYRQITVIDLFHGQQLYSNVQVSDYTQVLFAYGVESFIGTGNPVRCRNLIKELDD